jgi:thioredoxin-like negative regulator of GroEL
MENNSIYEFKSGDDIQKLLEGSTLPVIIDFYADWCGPCKELFPVIKERQASQSFNIIKVNVDDNPELEELFEVSSIPYVIGFVGKKKVGDFKGNSAEALDNLIGKFN